jgi:hypothetical protein
MVTLTVAVKAIAAVRGWRSAVGSVEHRSGITGVTGRRTVPSR